MSWSLGSSDLPDAPDIARVERTGLKPFELPFDPEVEAHCPCCGSPCDTLYRSESGEIIGCDVCIHPIDALDWASGDNDL